MSSNETKKTLNYSYTEKLSRNATVLSTLSMIPVAAQAGVVHVNSSLSISIDAARSFSYQPIDWDVDGDSIADFRLDAFRTIFYTGTGTYSYGGLSRPYGSLVLGSDGLNGRGMVQNTGEGPEAISALTTGETVGPTLGAGLQWGPSNQNRTMMTSSDYSGFASGSLFGPGNLIGFSFENSSNQTLYGWASVSLDEVALSLTINEWAYENNGGSIQVGQTATVVPTPPAFLMMLSGLALGAGGVLRGRKAREAARKQTENDAV